MVDRKAQTHAYTYDQANRLTQVSAGGQTLTYTYSPTSQRLTMVDPTGTTTYAYDNLDRLTSTQYPDGKTVTATYDDAGNRVTLTNPGAITMTAQYDGANRLTQLTQGSLTWTFQYDGAGNRTRLTHPNGTSTDYAYLHNHWLSSITDKTPGGAAFQTTSYGYDPNGNRISQTDPNGNRISQTDPSGQTTFGYDDLNRLTTAAYPAGYGTWGWTYDDVGNRLTQTGPSGPTTYTHDGNNRLTQATAGTTTTYSYDDNGNLLTISTGQSFTWDVFNRLTQATGAGGTVSHTYNGDGLKTRRVGPDGTRRYYHDGIRPIWETDDAGVMTAQYDRDIFGNLLSRREASGARRYYHFDGIGSTTVLTNETGTVTSSLLYDAWGNQRAATGADQGRYRFTGAELDQATSLYHMGARFYDPTIGRWLSEDPVQDKPFEPATLNFYAYVANNPVVLTDPAGTDWEDDIEAAEREGKERGKKQVEGRRTKEAIDAAAAALQSELAKVGISISIAQARQAVVGALEKIGSMSLKEYIENLYDGAFIVGALGAALFVGGVLLAAMGYSAPLGALAVRAGTKLGWGALGMFALGYALDRGFFGGAVFNERRQRMRY
jgi:RHS repeat-associated protein